MRYALLIYSNTTDEEWGALSDAERGAIYAEYGAVSQSPAVTSGAQLSAADMATTVRVKDGQTLTTDGPYAETKEVVGGFFIVESDSIDTALELAAKIPAARNGAVEVRPLVEM